jgi:hypothetical protein
MIWGIPESKGWIVISKTFPQMVCVVFLIAILAACAKSPQETEAVATPTVLLHEPEAVLIPTVGVWHLVIISESSGLGLGQVFADQIEKDVGIKVVIDDFAIGGNLTAVVVLQALETGKSSISRLTQLSAALKEANVVIMFANPMDSVDQVTSNSIYNCFASTPPTQLSPNAFEKYTTDLKAIWLKIFEIRAGQPTFSVRWMSPIHLSVHGKRTRSLVIAPLIGKA